MKITLSFTLALACIASISPVSAAPHGSPAWLDIKNALPPLPEGFRGVGWCTRMGDIPWKLSGGTVHTLYTREDENFTVFGAKAKYITYTSRNSVLYGVRIDIEGKDNVLRALDTAKKEYPPDFDKMASTGSASAAVEQVNARECRWSTRYTSLWVTLPEKPDGLGQIYLWGRDRVFPDDSKTPVYLNKPKELNYTLKKYQPRHYVIYRASGPVVIDGSINEKAWQDAQWTEPFEDAQSPYCPLPWKTTRAKILYDDKNLYVAARLQEENVWGHITQRDSIVYYDNDFEIFVDPTANAVNYYEYEMTCLNTMFDMWHENDNYRGALADGRYDAPGIRSAVQVQGTLNYHYDTDEGWTAEVMIPLADMKMKNPEMSLPIKRGDMWRMNFSRVEYLHIYTQPFPYLLPYSPCEDWVWNTTHIGDLHIPEMWAKVTFSNLYAGSVRDEALEGGPQILPPPPAPKERKKDMVHFPACSMTLGLDPTDPVHSPAHKVQVPEFQMDRYEVTVAEFAQFLNKGGNDSFYADKMPVPELCGIIRDAPGKNHVIPGRENYPVVFVSHDAALAYAGSLGKTLPTEAMFERAARGLEGRRFPWGNEALEPSRANYDFHYGGTLPVGSLPRGATPEGIFDLLGNVKEWTDSRLTPYPGGGKFAYWFNFPFFAPPYGEVPANWVNRGGGWTKQEKCMEIGYRDTEAAHNCGFRCVRVK